MNIKKKITNSLIMVICTVAMLVSTAIAAEPNEIADEELLEMSLEDLMDVEVSITSRQSSKLFETPSAVYVLTNEDIRRSGATCIPEALRMVPGIQVARINANKWAISCRGFNDEFSDKLLVMIDDRTVYTPLYAGVYWDVQDVMLEDIDKIEIVRGPGGTLWGSNAVNGIINIITKRAKDTQGTLATMAIGKEESEFEGVRFGDKLNDDAYYRVYAKYLKRDEGIFTSNHKGGNDHMEQFRTGYRIDWDDNDTDQFTLQGDVYNGQTGRDATMVTQLANIAHEKENEDVRGVNVLARWKRTLSETSGLAFHFYYDRNERYSYTLDQTIDIYDFDFQHYFALNDRHAIVWGAGYRNTGDNTHGTYAVSFDPASRTYEVVSTFVQDEITISEDLLKLIVGSKFERNNFTGFEYQPSIRLLWTPDKTNTVWTSFTRATQVPARVQSDYTNVYNSIPVMSITGTDDLKSQKLNSYELGYRTIVNDRLTLDTAGFYNEYSDLYSSEGGLTDVYGNKLYGETYGTEISSNYQASDNWKLSVGYSFVEMTLHRENSSTDASREKSTEGKTPHNTFHLRSFIDMPEGFEFDTLLYYVDNVPHCNIDNYIRLDLRLGWHINDNTELSFAVQNLLDSYHPEFTGVSSNATEVQRSFYGKLTIKF